MRLKKKKCPKCGKMFDAVDKNFPMVLITRKSTGLTRIKYSLCRNCVRVADRKRNKDRKGKLSEYCAKYNKANRKKRSKEAADRYAEETRLSLYGLTREQFDEINTGSCSICGAHSSKMKRRLHIDHDHETGKVRGMLCNTCNLGLGHFKDSPEILLSAVRYLGEQNV